MKKGIFTLLTILFLTNLFAQDNSVNFQIGRELKKNLETIIKVSGLDKTSSVTINGKNQTAGTFYGTKDGQTINFYCIDYSHPLAYEDYISNGVTSKEITYVLNNFYPYKSYPYAGALNTVNKEAAAVQVAIWHFSDGLALNTVTTNDVKNRAQQIINEAINSDEHPVQTLIINIPPQSFLKGKPVKFLVEAYDEANQPIGGVQVQLSTTSGTLSVRSATTKANGVSDTLTLTPGSSDLAKITATATLRIPQGTRFVHKTNPDGKQKIVLATPFTDEVKVTADVQWFGEPKLKIGKTGSVQKVKNGDPVKYEITVINEGNAAASDVKVMDKLSGYLTFSNASDVNYNSVTGIWNVGTVAAGETKKLTINCIAKIASNNTNLVDLGTAKDFNLFVLNDLYQPSCDTEGKVAVGNDCFLQGYSIADKLTGHDGEDMLIVGRKLTFKTGRVYYGNIVYGQSFYQDSLITNHDVQYLADGTIRKETVVDFAATETNLRNVSKYLSTLTVNGTLAYQGTAPNVEVHLVGTDPKLNVFEIPAEYTVEGIVNHWELRIPAGSLAVINVKGSNVTFAKGMIVRDGVNVNNADNDGVVGFGDVTPALKNVCSKIIYNFTQATSINLYNIGFLGSILAPDATLNFGTNKGSGTVYGQVMVKNMTGQGQFNWIAFEGSIIEEQEETIVNVAEILSFNTVASNTVSSTQTPGSGGLNKALGRKYENTVLGYNNQAGFIQILGVGESFATAIVDLDKSTVDVGDEAIPYRFELKQNYPNPFNPSTKVAFEVAKKGTYTVTVYNILGQEVKVLLNGELEAGKHSVEFDATGYSTGVYFLNVKGEGNNKTIKMVLTK